MSRPGISYDEKSGQIRQIWFQLVRIPKGSDLMECVVISIVAKFDVEPVQVVKQEDVFTLVAVSENVAGEVKRVELTLGRELGEIGELHG